MTEQNSPQAAVEPTGGIQSLDAALRLLAQLARYEGPVTLSEIARDCGMPVSKAHRYLASFLHAGLVSQTGRSGKYDLGSEAILLGLTALARHDFINRAADHIADLCDETGLTALLSVWGNQGPTVVRWERAASPIVTSLGLGTTMPLLNSATGRVFLAWSPPRVVEKHLEVALRRARRNDHLAPDVEPNRQGVRALAQKVRAEGYASVDSKFIPGLVAISAPVLDWQDEVQAAVTLIGTDPEVIRPDSEPVIMLKSFCRKHSLQRQP